MEDETYCHRDSPYLTKGVGFLDKPILWTFLGNCIPCETNPKRMVVTYTWAHTKKKESQSCRYIAPCVLQVTLCGIVMPFRQLTM